MVIAVQFGIDTRARAGDSSQSQGGGGMENSNARDVLQ